MTRKRRPDAIFYQPNRICHQGTESFRDYLKNLVQLSSAGEVARAAGIESNQLSDILAGRSSLGDVMVRRFGYRRVVTTTYEPLPEEDPA